MGRNKVKKNPGKKGQGKSVEVEGENLSKKSTFKLSEIVSDKAEVAVIASTGDDLRNNNNNRSRSAKGDICPCDICPCDIYPWRHLPIGDIYPWPLSDLSFPWTITHRRHLPDIW